jgi:hypothetical protein
MSPQATYPAAPGWWACYTLHKPDRSVVLVGMPIVIWEKATADEKNEYLAYVATRTGRVLHYLHVESNLTFLTICPPEEDWRNVAAMAYSKKLAPTEPHEDVFVADLNDN